MQSNLTSPLLDPATLSKLKAHERSLDDEAPFSSEGNPMIELTPELAAQLRKLELVEVKTDEFLRLERKATLKAQWSSMLTRSQPLTIGLKGDCLPSPALDIRLEDFQLPSGEERTIAWIPCILHLAPRPSSYVTKSGANAGTKVATLEMGKTTIRDSFATHVVPTIHEDPAHPGTFIRKAVSLSAFCSVTVHSSDPTDLHNALHEAQGNLPLATPSDFTPDSSRDADPVRDQARLISSHPDETPTSLNQPAFSTTPPRSGPSTVGKPPFRPPQLRPTP